MIPAPRTLFRGVRRLDLAQRLDYGTTGVRLSSHWRPSFEEDRREDVGALKQEFRDLLRSSVEDALDGADEAGCFLSGGTDSSTVAGLVAQITGRPARTFSIGFDAEGYDEMEYARIAARYFGTRHTEYYVTPQDLIDAIPKVARHYDQPFGNSSAVPAYHCARVARDAGVTRMLAGDGGDELFAGNARYAKQRVFSAYEAVPQGLRTGFVEPALLGAAAVRRLPLARKAASYVEQARVPMPDRMDTYNLLARLGIANVLAPEFMAQVDTAVVREEQRRVYGESRGGHLVNRMLAYDWKYTLADNDLPKVRETSRLAGVEVAFPFLTDALLDFSLRLAPELKLKRLKLRYFFKEALRGFLPDEIIAKKKHGFGLPFGVWLTRNTDLRAFASASLARLDGTGILRPGFTEELTGTRLAEHAGYYGEMIWILMMLSEWWAGKGGRAALTTRPSLPVGSRHSKAA
jgi:asparagine synthase (glutamine-hydrolysing)